jgi:subtilisin family serine protease
MACAGAAVLSAGPTESTLRSGVIAAAHDARPIWVFLRDKGHARSEIHPWVSPAAMARITLRGGAYNAALDIPVNRVYRDAVEDMGADVRAESRWFNALACRIPIDRLDDVASLPFVDSLQPVTIYRRPREVVEDGSPRDHVAPSPGAMVAFDYGLSLSQHTAIGVDSLHRAGLDGQGVKIGFLDTGFSLGIEVFDSLRLMAARDFIDGDDDVEDEDFAQMRHGTQTLSLCAGFAPGELIGVAPRAQYAVAKTEYVDLEIEIEESNWVAGLEWLDSIGCDLVSSSLGYAEWIAPEDFDGNTALSTIAADMAAARGMLVVNAAGNGGCGGGPHLLVPADGDSVLAVGAATLSGEKASFSSCGPTADGRIKPDVIAPGVGVRVAFPLTGYGAANGTSMATPIVTGVCALVLQNDPDLTPFELIERLRASGDAIIPGNDIGWGFIRAVMAAGIIVDRPWLRDLKAIRAWPNPATDRMTVSIPREDLMAGNGTTQLQVYAINGRIVFDTLFEGQEVEWNGRTADGNRIATGIYLCRVKTPLQEDLIKIAWKSAP